MILRYHHLLALKEVLSLGLRDYFNIDLDKCEKEYNHKNWLDLWDTNIAYYSDKFKRNMLSIYSKILDMDTNIDLVSGEPDDFCPKCSFNNLLLGNENARCTPTDPKSDEEIKDNYKFGSKISSEELVTTFLKEISKINQEYEQYQSIDNLKKAIPVIKERLESILNNS